MQQLRRTVIATAAVLMISSQAMAIEASDLAGMCRNEVMRAADYVNAFFDKWRDDRVIVDGLVGPGMKDKDMASLARFGILGDFCLPEATNVALALRVGCDWVETHPEKGKLSAPRALLNAYEAAWPCKR